MDYEVGNRVADPDTEPRHEIGRIEDPDEDLNSVEDEPAERRPAQRPEILLPGRHYRLD